MPPKLRFPLLNQALFLEVVKGRKEEQEKRGKGVEGICTKGKIKAGVTEVCPQNCVIWLVSTGISIAHSVYPDCPHAQTQSPYLLQEKV